MRLLGSASDCSITIKEHRVDEVKSSGSSLFIDLSMADYVELIIRDSAGVVVHYPYRVIYTRDGELLLVRTESYGDNRLRKAYSRCVREVARGLLPDLVNGIYYYLVVDLVGIAYGQLVMGGASINAS